MEEETWTRRGWGGGGAFIKLLLSRGMLQFSYVIILGGEGGVKF